MPNIGLFPPDPTTKVGQFRFTIGDFVGVPADPPTDPQTAEYEHWSDLEIEALLSAAGDSVTRAISLAYARLAANATTKSASIRTDDLSYSNKDQISGWLSLAAWWSDRADAEDASAVDDMFEIVSPPYWPMRTRPELAIGAWPSWGDC